jgi:hypothetical protein
MTTAAKYRRYRPALIRLLQREGEALNQEQMAAMAFKAARGSVLIRCGALGKAKGRQRPVHLH